MRNLVTLLLLLFTLSAHATTPTGLAPRTGLLLVASEQIADPRFQQSVILITRHDMRGTSGLILNRQLGKLPPDLEKTLHTLPRGIFWGGPVEPLQVRALLFGQPPAGSDPLAPGLHLLHGQPLNELLHQSDLPEGELRVYLGYAGWAPAQLAREISRGDWIVVQLGADTLKDLQPLRMWPALLPASPSPWI
ncbi:MAG: hypothetical protein C0624_07640 [Desulfuromonas sp.]|nr:MAG: hypothetical protein C0624_07640 [Desulfuromonas sp.]